MQVRDCGWAVAESEKLATEYTIGLPPSSRQPVHGPEYKRLRELLGHAVPLENDSSTCVSSGVDASVPPSLQSSTDRDDAPVSMLCRHNATAAEAAGKPGVAHVSKLFFHRVICFSMCCVLTPQTWMLLSQMVGLTALDHSSAANVEQYTPSSELKQSLECCGRLLEDEVVLKQKSLSVSSTYTTKPMFSIPPPPPSVAACKRAPVDKAVRVFVYEGDVLSRV